jgi:hypothetical protein
MREAGLAADGSRSAGEDHGATAERHEPARRLAPHQKATEAADAPEILELRGRQFAEVDALIVPGIRNDKIHGFKTIAGRHGAVKQPHDVILARRIRHDRFGAAARGQNRLGNLADFRRGAPRHQHMMAALCKAPAQCSAKAAFGADADNDSR